ncbi:MAG: DinB family protein [Ignavibacteriales bacterium]|nr:hypothetical protein [Ignavibacteriaceae bacterium]MCK6615391.1 DinB family protein [Ignavibacteriaceae bacterium]QOJ28110.1 MAG: DinB family protein [Ignavibacteriales bacterium]
MERAALLNDYRNGYKKITEAMKAIPFELWDYKPSPEKWSVREILIHLADSEANGYVRCRKILSEPGSELMVFDQDKWAGALQYSGQDIDMAMILFKTLREANFRMLASLTEEEWGRSAFHPERGKMTMDDWLLSYTSHVDKHIGQMLRNAESAGK